MSEPVGVATYEENLYSNDAILDPYPHYLKLRRLGPAVWLAKHRVYALPRYAECKAVLRRDEEFRSGAGVGLSNLVNAMSGGTLLNSDGDDHDRRRKLVAHRLLPRALRDMAADIERQADDLVAAAVTRRNVDGVRDLAIALPLSVVPDLIGWPQNRRKHLLDWGAATFNALGPFNRFAVRSVPATFQMLRFSKEVVRRRSAAPGSMGYDIIDAGDAGELSPRECSALIIDYLVPSLDTTISGIASALALFAAHPEQWQLLRSQPALLPNAVNEVLRYESPLRAFSRKVAADTDISGVPIPVGARLLVMYASANRDEDAWTDPALFNISRDATRQLGFGHGTHACAGQGLARMEIQAILTALMHQVSRIELAGKPKWARNNIIRCYERLPLRLTPA